MSKIAIILNGPPGCGKDTLANLIETRLPFFRHIRFKTPLIHIAAILSGKAVGEILTELSNHTEKNIPKPEYFNKSLRSFLIEISEVYLKPNLGEDVLGKLALDEIQNRPNTHYVFSDGGFPQEVEYLAANFVHVIVMRMHRHHCDFSGDSRTYITKSSLRYPDRIRIIDLQNTTDSLEDLMDNAMKTLLSPTILLAGAEGN